MIVILKWEQWLFHQSWKWIPPLPSKVCHHKFSFFKIIDYLDFWLFLVDMLRGCDQVLGWLRRLFYVRCNTGGWTQERCQNRKNIVSTMIVVKKIGNTITKTLFRPLYGRLCYPHCKALLCHRLLLNKKGEPRKKALLIQKLCYVMGPLCDRLLY